MNNQYKMKALSIMRMAVDSINIAYKKTISIVSTRTEDTIIATVISCIFIGMTISAVIVGVISIFYCLLPVLVIGSFASAVVFYIVSNDKKNEEDDK